MAQKKRGNKLNDNYRRQIVQWLAEFVSVAEVMDRVEKDFGIELTNKAIQYYLPQNATPKWRAEFERHRAAYLADIDSIALRHRKNRIAELVKMYHEVQWRIDKVLAAGGILVKDANGNPIIISKKDIGIAAALLEQIAKEVGDAQARQIIEHTGRNGAPIQISEAPKIVLYMPDNGRGDKHEQ